MKALAAIWVATACLGCGLFGPGGRYAPRDKSCVVKTLSGAPKVPVDDLGIVTVDCWTGNNDECQQELLDEVCRRGGDIVWGVGNSALNTSKLEVHVAQTRAPGR
jgi:hypothetical protein